MFKLSVILVSFMAFLGTCSGFLANVGAGRTLARAGALKMMPLESMTPAILSTPSLAVADIMNTLPVSLEVTFAAYLAVLLGTFVPVTFLIVLYSQSEARKAGARGEN